MIKSIDLSGDWKLYLEKTLDKNPMKDYNDWIALPSTTSYSKKGEKNPRHSKGFLTDEYLFNGYAWFSKRVKLEGVFGKRVFLFLERTRITTLYFDGKEIGNQESLVSPHIYDISGLATDGEHEITICVQNVGYKTLGGHLTSEDTQSNWNGIVGSIEIRVFENTYIDNLFVEGDIKSKAFNIRAAVVGESNGTVEVSAESFNGPYTSNKDVFEPLEFSFENSQIDITYTLGDKAKLWSEFEPNLYMLKIKIGNDITTSIAGLREFKTSGDKFTINGKNTFLRGKHDGMVFPKTGYAPCDVDEWLRVMEISRAYGINHYRFHTCCPPEAAFIAADMLGIYMEPELPFWGTISAPDEEGFNKDEQEFLIAEGERMLKAFGNHPSYCMMSLGNELWGSTSRLNEILGLYKSKDKRHLYTQGSNNFQHFPTIVDNDDFFVGVRLSKHRLLRGSFGMCDTPLGHVQVDKPSTMVSYDDVITPKANAEGAEGVDENGMVKIQYGTTMKLVKASETRGGLEPKIPIVTHEIGQYETYPNFDEIDKFTGPLKARNLGLFKNRLEKKGLGNLAHAYHYASGKLAAACYKEELEAVFRSRKLGGFQILDIQDFQGQGTALVGILDAFMDSKGIITEKEWRAFCSETVLLAKFNSYVYQSGDKFSAHLMVTHFGKQKISGKSLSWSVTIDDKIIKSGSEVISGDENYYDVSDIELEIPKLDTPNAMILTLSLDGEEIQNQYKIFVYPSDVKAELDGVYIFESADDAEAKRLLSEGKTVLITKPLKSDDEGSIEGFYCQDFWCYPMFKTISQMMNAPVAVGTMGLLIDNKHSALAEFPSEIYSTEQWWDIVTNSRSDILDFNDKDKTIIVRTIDNFERNHSLGLLYEYEKDGGKVVVLNCDLNALSETPNGRQFVKSVFDYVRN
ncbi:MAG: beta-glucuronidase [Ruminococcus sp.]|nr:beta-glucuronidase [Ruminococcus sp.]